MSVNTNERKQVAHGFNEELTILLNTAAVASTLLDPDHPANDAILELKRSVDRCAELTRRLAGLAC